MRAIYQLDLYGMSNETVKQFLKLFYDKEIPKKLNFLICSDSQVNK